MKKKHIVFFLGIIVTVSFLLFYFRSHQKSVSDKHVYITYVDGEGILRSDYEKELARTKHFFVWAKQDVTKLTSLEKNVLDRMIEMKIVSQYAQKNTITVSQKDIDVSFRATLGKKSEAVYLAKIKEMYGMEKEDYLRKLTEDMLKEKVQAHVKIPLSTWLLEMKKTVVVN